MSAKPMTGLEKAAVLLKSLSPAIVEKVLGYMEPKQVGLVRTEIAKVTNRPDLKEAIARVFDEAVDVLASNKPASSDPPALRIFDKGNGPAAPAENKAAASGPKPGPKVDVRIAGGTTEADAPDDSDPLAALASLSPDVLATALASENARTIALLMNGMNAEAAGQIYRRLPGAKRKEVSLRFTEPTTVADELLRHIAGAVLKKCRSLRATGSSSNDQGEREKRMAGFLRGLERTERMETLTALEEADAALAGRIKAMLYLFEDILRMENSSIQKLFTEIDVRALAAALYEAPQEIQDRIRSNLSRRAQESLKEEIELSGKVQSAKVKQSRQMLEEAMQRLDQRGEFLLIE